MAPLVSLLSARFVSNIPIYIGEVIKTIVDDEETFPDYRIPKTPTGKKKRRRSRRAELPAGRRAFP